VLRGKFGFALVAVMAAAAASLVAPTLANGDSGSENPGILGTLHKGIDSATASTKAANPTDGLVLIDTEVGYGQGEAAGTGLVLMSNGIVITNHHVVAGSTSVTVTDPANGKTYDADVLGYDPTYDVAVLQLQGATSLPTVTISAQPVSPGASVTAVGNAEGGGQLVTVSGQVTNTGVTVSVSQEDGSGDTTLTNLVQTTAPLVPGDSGGAMLDNSSRVFAMNVAGSPDQATSVGYGIPIMAALKVATGIISGQPSSTTQMGRTGGLGVVVSTQPGAPRIRQVVAGGAAAKAGITSGSTLVSLDGTTLSSADQLTSILAAHKPGDTVQASWKDRSGRSHDATVTLGVAPLA